MHDEAELTGAVFGSDRVSVVTRGADVTVRAARVMHAAETLPSQRVTVGEKHVGVRIAVAMAKLAPAAQHHGVAVVTWGAPVLTKPFLMTHVYLTKGFSSCCRSHVDVNLLTRQ